MAAELTQLEQELQEIRHRAEQLVAGLTPEQLTRRPDPAKWSIAECLAHLNLTAEFVQPKIAAAIEQGHDPRGILFPAPIAPFEVCLVPIGYQKSTAVREATDRLYQDLVQAGVDVLLDDREERPGVLFADMDLIGIPHRVVLGERGLAAGNAEYKARRDDKGSDVPLADIVPFIRQKLA